MRPHLLCSLVILIFPFAAAANAQDKGISISAGVNISADSTANPHAESFLAVNPRDPRSMLATSIAIENNSTVSALYLSTDGGKGWQRIRSIGDSTIFKGGDPIVYFGPTGIAYFGTIQGSPTGFLLARSTDGGTNWEAPVTIPGGSYDRQYLAFDHTGGRFDGRVYASGCISIAETNGKRHSAIAVTFSTDGGRTFSPAKIIGPPSVTAADSADGIFTITDPLVGPDGQLIIPFSTYHRGEGGGSMMRGDLWSVMSVDGGVTFSPAQRGPERNRAMGYLSSKSDAAPRAAMDLSTGPYRGRIYLSWMNYDGKSYNTELAYSSDLGKTWSKSLKVNDSTGKNDPSNPAVAVNRDGIVAVTFNDRRDDPKDTCYRLYAAISLDGGATVLPNRKIGAGPTCPASLANFSPDVFTFLDLPLDLTKEQRRPVIAFMFVPSRWPNGGDTQGLDADSDGVFHLAWLNGESGVMQLWSGAIVVDRNALPPAPPKREDLSSMLQFELSQGKVDFNNHVISVNVRLLNPTKQAVEGPFTVVLDDYWEGNFQNLKVGNADNKIPGLGAAWNFSESTLQPNQKSPERTLRWDFTGDPPEEPQDLRAHFRILGKTEK
jgi:hypothetical protein